jgi:mRNA interferase MazF
MISQRDIVLILFPFSDLKSSKVRPALVLSNNKYNKKFEDFIAIPLTTNVKLREYSILITNKNLEKGRLVVDSNVKIDRVNNDAYNRIKKMLVELIE